MKIITSTILFLILFSCSKQVQRKKSDIIPVMGNIGFKQVKGSIESIEDFEDFFLIKVKSLEGMEKYKFPVKKDTLRQNCRDFYKDSIYVFNLKQITWPNTYEDFKKDSTLPVNYLILSKCIEKYNQYICAESNMQVYESDLIELCLGEGSDW